MGFWDNFVRSAPSKDSASPARVKAQIAPAVYDAPFGQAYGSYGFAGWNNYANSLNRYQALSVPAVSACRNLIANTIATIPLEMFSLSTGEEVPSPLWLKQPDERAPRSVTIAFTVDSLIFYGVAYWQIKKVDFDGRPLRFEWIQNDRVTVKYNKFNTEVDYYMVNNEKVPMDGVGSLITFQHLDQPGFLFRAARTIKSALDLEAAVNVATATPQPTGYIRNNGSDLPDEQVQGLLNTWRNARQNRATAYLTQSLEYVPTAFSPKDMTYNESTQMLATQIARAMNVPTWMIDAEQMKSMTYQNIIDARKDFMTYTLYPYIEAVQSRLSMPDMITRGNQIRFDIDSTFLKVNATERLAVLEKMLQLGLIDIDQAKQMENLAPDRDNEVEESSDI